MYLYEKAEKLIDTLTQIKKKKIKNFKWIFFLNWTFKKHQ